jgi:hypothetical protein
MCTHQELLLTGLVNKSIIEQQRSQIESYKTALYKHAYMYSVYTELLHNYPYNYLCPCEVYCIALNIKHMRHASCPLLYCMAVDNKARSSKSVVCLHQTRATSKSPSMRSSESSLWLLQAKRNRSEIGAKSIFFPHSSTIYYRTSCISNCLSASIKVHLVT